MILLWLIVILLVGGPLAWAAGRWSALASRWISLIAVSADFVIGLTIWIRSAGHVDLLQQQAWLRELDWNWIPQFGIHFHLALDGLSLLLLMLTFFLGIMSVLSSWTEIQEAVGFFHLNLLWVLAGIAGVFLAMDLFSVLLRMGTDAGSHVFPDRDLGPRAAGVRGDEVLPLHSAQRAADADRDPGSLFRTSHCDWHFYV